MLTATPTPPPPTPEPQPGHKWPILPEQPGGHDAQDSAEEEEEDLLCVV